jgi:hypothetical protein
MAGTLTLLSLVRLQVCDFAAYSGQPLYLINKSNATLTTSVTPFFCHSHLIMKINVGAAVANAPAPNLNAFNQERLTGPLPQSILEVGSPSDTVTHAVFGQDEALCHFGLCIVLLLQHPTTSSAAAG